MRSSPSGADDGSDILDLVAQSAGDMGLQVVRLDHAVDNIDLAVRFVLPGDLHPSAQAHAAIGRALATSLEPAVRSWEER